MSPFLSGVSILGSFHISSFYADDLIVFADSEVRLQAKIHLLVHALQRIGLQVNPSKCKVLNELGGGTCPGIWLPSSAIPLRGEDKLTFLGIPLGHGVGATTIMAHPLRKASNTFFAFKRLLDDAATPLHVRLALFERASSRQSGNGLRPPCFRISELCGRLKQVKIHTCSRCAGWARVLFFIGYQTP